MGTTSSKAHSVPSTPNKTIGGLTALTRSEGIADLPQLDNIDPMLDPRSPNIERTPLAVIFGTDRRIKKLVNNVCDESGLHTPSNMMRRRLLRDLGHNYTEKELNLLDPRSPSTFIPRTPIVLSESQKERHSESSTAAADVSNSFEYTECLEDASCRNFSEKISNITLDDVDNQTNDKELSGKERERKYLETNFDIIEEPVNDVAENEDPRSPSLNLYRTPIVLPALLNHNATNQNASDSNVNMDNSLLDIIEPVFSSTPTTVATIDTPKKKLNQIENKQKNLIYEDEHDGHIEDNILKIQDDFILMTPVQKFNQKDGEKRVRTPLSVINRRTKSAENLSTKQSRIRPMDENTNNFNNKKSQNENTPKTSMIPMRVPLSNKNSISKIPMLKRREL